MLRVKVYEFEVWNPEARCFSRTGTFATPQAIAAADGVLLPHTAREVDAEFVSPDGVVVRWPVDGHDSDSHA